jgi:hypothetical protein
MHEAAKIWFKARLTKWSIKLFNFMYRNPLTGMKDIVENAVNQRSVGAIMAWLESKGLQHCVFCPATEGLFKHEAGYVCQRHHAMAQKELERRQKQKV